MGPFHRKIDEIMTYLQGEGVGDGGATCTCRTPTKALKTNQKRRKSHKMALLGIKTTNKVINIIFTSQNFKSQ